MSDLLLWERGKIAEQFFLKLFENRKVPVEFVDDSYDFVVNNNVRVEVKSCKLTTYANNSKTDDKRTVGRYILKMEEERYNELVNIGAYYCFIIRKGNECFLQGFCPVCIVDKCNKLSIVAADSLPLISLEEFLNKLSIQMNEGARP